MKSWAFAAIVTLALLGCRDWAQFNADPAAAGGGGATTTTTSTSDGGTTTGEGAGPGTGGSGTGAGGTMMGNGGSGGGTTTTSGTGGGPPLPMCQGNVVPWLTSGVAVLGDTFLAPSVLDAVCASTGGGERVFAFELTAPGDVIVDTNLPGTDYDVIAYVRSVCDDQLTEVGCDDASGGETYTIFGLPAGIYFVIADSHTPVDEGNFELTVTW